MIRSTLGVIDSPVEHVFELLSVSEGLRVSKYSWLQELSEESLSESTGIVGDADEGERAER